MIFTAKDKLEAVERELGYRRRVYVRRVMNKQMTQELADRQIAVFEAILADYVEMEKRDRLI
jgi:type IV secretory pathway TrbD component